MIAYYVTGRAVAILNTFIGETIYGRKAILLINKNVISVYDITSLDETQRNLGFSVSSSRNLSPVIIHRWTYDYEWNRVGGQHPKDKQMERYVDPNKFKDSDELAALCYVLKGMFESVTGKGQLTSKTCNQGLLDLGMKPIVKWHVNYLTHGISFEDLKTNGEKTNMEDIQILKN